MPRHKLDDPRMSPRESDWMNALDYACDVLMGPDVQGFLQDWRLGNLAEWPDYRRYCWKK